MWRTIAFLLVLTMVIIPLHAGKQEASTSAEELSLLGNPRERMQKINRLLREAGEKVMEQKRMLDDTVARIITNERKIATSTLSTSERLKLRAANIAAFHEIETIRERIARIQFDTAHAVYQLEQAAYQSMINDISQKNAEININPLAYWLTMRRLLMTPSELSSNLSENDLNSIYR